MDTLVVNFFAGPSAGKTTCAWEVAAELKKRNIVTEYVPEYAKELVWDGRRDLLDGSYDKQLRILNEQAHRIDRLIGKVDVVVTDSPVLLQPAYCKENQAEFEQAALRSFNSHNNFNLFINRGEHFEQAGRIHNLAESRKVDGEVKDILARHGVYYGTYSHSTIDLVVENIQKTLRRIQSEHKIFIEGGQEMPETPEKQSLPERAKELTDKLETGMKELYQSDKYTNYLKTMAQFHHYSPRNIMLIQQQLPNATRVASFKLWEEMNRHVKKGEHSVKIYAPIADKKPEIKLMEKLDPETGAPLLDEQGKLIMEEMTALTGGPRFKLVSVFDVSQTYGEPLPQLAENLTGDVAHYEAFLDALKAVSPLPVVMEPMAEEQDGYCRYGEQIGIREGMSETQTVAAVIHEITHAKLHDPAVAAADTPAADKTKRVKEIEAESV
ncbi:MAG: ATP-binding protein, partial [Firmicutes bacterium]|nr:ATP-binding protein [Bacillota bacterium]